MVLVSNLSNYGDIIYFFNSFFNFYFPYKIKNICDSYFFFKNSSSLLNSLSFYHPAMLYIYIYSSFLFIYFRNNIFFFKESKNYKNEHFIIISFILSMLWSSQEIFWNGFWNWDMVEISLFNIVFLSVWSKHVKFFFKNNLKKQNLFFILIFFFVLSNKTNLIFSQHSFSSFFLYKIPNIFYFFFIFFFFKKINHNVFYCTYGKFSFYLYFYIAVFYYYCFYKSYYNVKPADFLFKYFHYSVLFYIFKNWNILVFLNFKFFFLKNIIFLKKKKKIVYKITHYLYVLYVYIYVSFINSYSYLIDFDYIIENEMVVQTGFFKNLGYFVYNNNTLNFFNPTFYNFIFFVFYFGDFVFSYTNSLSVVYCI